VSYTAVATSRYREYFPQDENLNFTRESEPVLVDVPASERPHAASVAYVLPTFGWQRQTDTNLKRSVRFGGGLRVTCTAHGSRRAKVNCSASRSGVTGTERSTARAVTNSNPSSRNGAWTRSGRRAIFTECRPAITSPTRSRPIRP